MNEAVLTADLRKSLINRLCELEPWMQIDAVQEIVERCSKLLEDGMQNQQHAISAAKRRTSFLSLPAELRTRIYELTVIPPNPRETNFEPRLTTMDETPAIRLGHDYSHNPEEWDRQQKTGGLKPNKWTLQPAITRTSRQLRSEALPIYYSQNEFVTGVDDRMTKAAVRVNEIRFPNALRWLKAIGPENRKLLTAISLRGGSLNYRWVSARRFLALMAKEGIDDLPQGVVRSFYLENSVDQFGRAQTSWIQATEELEEQHSQFGDEPEKI